LADRRKKASVGMTVRLLELFAARGARLGARLATAVFVLLLGSACGGGDSGGRKPGPVLGGGDPGAAVCAGGDLSGLTQKIFVSTKGQDSASCGQSTAAACKTIQQGLANCGAAGCGVLVQWGLYASADAVSPLPDHLVLRNGVALHGSCLFDGEPDHPYRTTVQGPPDGRPVATADQITSATPVSGLVMIASDAQTAGQPSIAVTANGSAGLALTQVQLVAGRGGSGAAGAYSNGQAGGAGQAAGGPFNGGAGGAACPSSGSALGGWGGNGANLNHLFTVNHLFFSSCRSDNSPGTGPNGQDGQASGKVAGGTGGGTGSAGCACGGFNTSTPGDAPTAPSGGQGACATIGGKPDTRRSFGMLAAGWSANLGGAGQPGDVGSGGGGGGGGGYGTAVYGPDISGYAGGGGGGGGCGGTGGGGGQQGGASIGLLAAGSAVQMVNSLIAAGPGGFGGTGAQGGQGGPGGGGQAGYPGHNTHYGISLYCDVYGPGSGGSGGPGGQGGAGAGGSGGPGGPSIALALADETLTAPTSSGQLFPGLPGAGGQNGPGGQNTGNPCTAPFGQGGVPGGRAAAGANLMVMPEVLNRGQSRSSLNARFQLALGTDGNLVLSDVDGSALWSSGTNDGYTAIMQTDGNFCVYDQAGHWRWCSHTDGHPQALLKLRNDGNLVLLEGQQVLWQSNTARTPGGHLLAEGERLSAGQSRTSPNGHQLVMQGDGNFVLYRPGGGAVWASNTNSGAYAVMQPDGNLCVYDSGNHYQWCSSTPGHPHAYLSVQDAGNAVVYDGTVPLWTSNLPQ